MATSFPSVEQLNKARTEASQFSGGPTYSLTFTVDGKQYSYIPSNIAENGGMTAGENTYLLPYFTSLDNLKDFGSKAQEVDLSTTGVNKYLQSQGLSEKGYLIPFASVPFDSVVNPIPTEVFGGELNGLKVIDGQVAYGLSGGHGRRYATTTGEVHDPYIKQNDSFLAGLGSVIQNMGPLAGFIGNLIAPGLGTGISIGSAVAQGASPEDLAKSYIASQLGNQVGTNIGGVEGQIAGSTVSGLASGQSLEDALTNAAIKTGMSQVTSGKPSTGALPGGTQVASTDGGLPEIEVGKSPIFADSQTIGDVKAPAGYELMPAWMNEKDANGNWLRPEGSYYDAYQNAWIMPNAEDTQALKDLQAQLQNPTDTTSVTPPLSSGSTDFIPPVLPTSTDTSGSGTGVGIGTTTGALPTTTEPPVTEIPEVVVKETRDPYTGDIQMDLSGTPTTTTPAKITTGTGPSTPTSALSGAAGTTAFPYTSIDQVLDSSPQYLGYTLGNQNVENQAQNPYELKQLYDSLDPALAEQLRLRGIAPQATASNTIDPQLTSTKLVANGGTIKSYAAGSTVTSDLYDSSVFNPKITKANPNMLPPAPVVQMPSRLGTLKHIFSGIGSRQPHLATGGLPSKYTEAAPKGHNPEFVTGLTGYYAQGKGTGQSDDIPAMLHDGDYVADADLVAALGDGSSKAGAEALEKFRRQIPHQESAEGGAVVPAKIADGEYVFPASFVTAIGRGDNKAGAKLLDAMRQEIRAHKRSAPTSKIPPKAKSPLDYLKMVKG